MKILITGASGYLGSYLYTGLAKNHDLIGLTGTKSLKGLIRCDITNKNQVLQIIKEQNPQVIIHCAGISNTFDKAPENGKLVNITGTENIAFAVSSINSKLIYFSSAAVFNGQEGVFTENDIPKTDDEYGKTKIEAEKIIKSYNFPHLIIRPSLIVGTSPHGRDNKLTSKIINSISQKFTTELDNDWVFGPSYNLHIKEVIDWWLSKDNKSDLLHVTTSETTTKMQLAISISRKLNLKENLFKEKLNVVHTGNNILSSKRLTEIGAPEYLLNDVISELSLAIKNLTKTN